MVLPQKHLMRTSKAKFEFRKIVHLIERSEMMVLSQEISHQIFLWRG